jgi:hypothetical protein
LYLDGTMSLFPRVGKVDSLTFVQMFWALTENRVTVNRVRQSNFFNITLDWFIKKRLFVRDLKKDVKLKKVIL